MTLRIVVHSFRHGVGRSTIVANFSYLLAAEGRRTAVIDTDVISPALHTVFGVSESYFKHTLDDFLDEQYPLSQAAYALSGTTGNLFLIPVKPGPIMNAHPLAPRHFKRLNDGCIQLEQTLQLQALLIDTSPGLDRESLSALTLPHVFIVILRHDRRDYHGTAELVNLMRQLNVSRVALVINEVPASLDFAELKTDLEKRYNVDVLAILPHQQELMALENRDIFARRYPTHLFTNALRNAISQLILAV